MKLYYAPGTISIAVAIALEEAGLRYEPAKVDFKNQEQTKPDFRRMNPKGRVPVLQVGEFILTETGALLDYIAEVAPEAGLVPDDPISRAKMRETMYFLAGTMHVNHAHRFRGQRWADTQASWVDMAAKVPENMAENAAYLEETCALEPYVLGDRFSLADPYLFLNCRWLAGDGVDIANYPKLARFFRSMNSRDSVRRVTALGML